MSQHEVTLLLGSNLGNPENNIEKAITFIEQEIGSIEKRSEVLITKPVEFDSTNIFCNIALLIKTQESPVNILNLIKSIEKKMGREYDTIFSGEYQDRIIDIDIVSICNLFFWSRRLEIPHVKHLHQRDFSRKLLEQLE
ncbi:2-amino-4-hydroxy-6-hydroxymethyldihydropteridine diphosphokinase [Chryseobacterium sp. SNU WT5]|uniref:2-amino-4-hydroxy-6- hydroxymethyldihydropteridine diphosphokinase n=1 Tax=Chryseobacterium sp. SNU WT5 TaxID=2594269 RepID=UPI0011803C03|nr:2-amino-4-hydroxy-6-hydroxymethyldihydropteridine diphosphokinase [Chryseobacterium sp. SNU WT5]QDP84673.1 2-amino-4-hydroxy-6-hydroxymethyldihydropteridine diphosphokinase [Chryseobacterium sp. SNU WT5]